MRPDAQLKGLGGEIPWLDASAIRPGDKASYLQDPVKIDRRLFRLGAFAASLLSEDDNFASLPNASLDYFRAKGESAARTPG